MKLKRHQHHSLTAELKQYGLHSWSFPTHISSGSPTSTSRIVQTTSMYKVGQEHLLYFDDNGVFLNRNILSPYECTFVEDLPYNRMKVLGSINTSIPLKTLTAFLISADIIRTFVDVESHMMLYQVHSKMIKVHGYYVYHDRIRHVVPFGFSVTIDAFHHVCICRHSVKNIVSSLGEYRKAC
jgi:hypothetical protein